MIFFFLLNKNRNNRQASVIIVFRMQWYILGMNYLEDSPANGQSYTNFVL